jgi:hypothetical protein
MTKHTTFQTFSSSSHFILFKRSQQNAKGQQYKLLWDFLKKQLNEISAYHVQESWIAWA